MNKYKAILTRALKTFIQAILGVWTAGMLITDVDWKVVLLSALSATIYSVLNNLLVALPEVENERGENLVDYE